MAIKVILNIDGIADAMGTAAYGTAAVAVIERGTAQADPSYAAAGTVSLVSTQSQYEWWDKTATAGSWYRFRIWDGQTTYSAFSDPFQMGALSAYATLDDFLERVPLPDESRYNLVGDILRAVSDQFDLEAGRSFYRIPQVSGEATRTYDFLPDGAVEYSLWLPEGCSSLSKVEVAGGTGATFAEVAASGYRLRPAYPTPGWPYTQLILTDLATAWPGFGYDVWRLTGVFGWSAVPTLVTEAVLELAQMTYNMSQTRAGGAVGLPEFGAVTLPTMRPDAWYRALRSYARRGGQPI